MNMRWKNLLRIAFAWAALLSLALCAAHTQPGLADGSKQPLQYHSDIRPILAANCFPCHGADKNKRQANLRLDQSAGLKERGVLVPRHPESSLLVARTSAVGTPMQMPPPSSGKRLTPAQIALIARWVREGGQYQPHWSYVPLQRPAVPVVRTGPPIVANPIDAFILARLKQKGIAPSPEADRRTLIRRLSLDLIGIPPTPNEVQDFLSDRSAAAYEKVVDRLLASPHFGERMAVPWLDLVRYADTVGFHGDQNMNAWAYRDYVINAFNANKPFDRFTLEQLAGDIIPDATIETRIATCFNRLNKMTREGGAQPKEYLAKYAADRVRTVSMTWLGSTMGCCECHDHKYDPFTARDFYSLASFFADIKQWGVYQDYDYTPNPDLRGWSNDHPFPPEIVVDSPYLQNRIKSDFAARRALAITSAAGLQKDAAAAVRYAEWRRDAADFLSKRPDGWAMPTGATATGPDGKPAGPKPMGTAQPDGSVLLAPDAPADFGVMAAPDPGWVASVCIELLTDPSYKGSILRGPTGMQLQVSMQVVDKDSKARPIAVRHALANYHEPRYYNGFEILGLQQGWRLSALHEKQAHRSIWILDTPVRIETGERLVVAFRGVRLGRVRVSVSPFAPSDPDSLALSADTLSACAHATGPMDHARGPHVRRPGLAEGAASATCVGTDVRHGRLPMQRPYSGSVADNPVALEAYLRGTAWDATAFAKLQSLEADIVRCTGGKTPVMVVEHVEPYVMRVLPRGNWQSEAGEIVHPAVPAFLPDAQALNARPLNRIDLARWLVSRDNPLTARVFVNRLWKLFFGAGISASVEDAGTQGEWPVHAELLDWLACEFRQPTVLSPHAMASHPWDIKHIVKLIVMSSTYRQSSMPRPDLKHMDPDNRLLARQNPRRLEAEFVRDNALAIGELLNLDMGGPPCHPYQPAKYYENLQFPDREYQPDKDDRQWRRGVYTHWQRTFLLPSYANFDAPTREDCTAFRTVANTPQQALTLLNDPEYVEAARGFAQRLLSRPHLTDSQRIRDAYSIALCRYPRPQESQALLAFLKSARLAFRETRDDARKLEAVGYWPVLPGVDANELAAWTTMCRVILNLHETITRY